MANMASVTLVDEMLGLQNLAAASDILPDFVTSIGASNGMLIPLEVLVQTRLPDKLDHAHAQLLKHEYEHKSALLDADRQITACVCTIAASAHDATSEDRKSVV